MISTFSPPLRGTYHDGGNSEADCDVLAVSVSDRFQDTRFLIALNAAGGSKPKWVQDTWVRLGSY